MQLGWHNYRAEGKQMVTESFPYIFIRKLLCKHVGNSCFSLSFMCIQLVLSLITHTTKITITITWKMLNLLKSSPEIRVQWNLNKITSLKWPPSPFSSFDWHLLHVFLALQTECHIRSWYYSQPFDLFPLDYEKCWSEPNTEMDCRPSIRAAEQDFRPPLHLCFMLWV